MASPKLNLVVAMCNNRGIGIDGALPWRIRGDMAFFKKITTETKKKDMQNAVIMGRKTWESIPAKFRPLANRTNVVISSTLSSVPDGVHIVRGFDEAITLFDKDPLKNITESIYIIGGASIYKVAVESPLCHRVYLTKVLADIKCDTFMPPFSEAFQLVSDPDIDSSVQKEKDFEYKFEVYEKIHSAMANKTFNICAAMLENRGIGKNGMIAWPPIKKDFEYYLRQTSAVTIPGMKCMNIYGRGTWPSVPDREKNRPSVINVVISKTLRECPEGVYKVVESLDAALELANSSTATFSNHCSAKIVSSLCDIVENIWVMGGEQTYRVALNHPSCKQIYLTRIFSTYPSDTFFPEFESRYSLVNRVQDIDGGLQEEDGTKFKFEVYERKPS